MIEYYSAIKNEMLILTTWMNLGKIMLSEMSHNVTNIIRFHLYEISRIGTFIKIENRLLAIRYWGNRNSVVIEFVWSDKVLLINSSS